MRINIPERVQQKLDELPTSPGCYLMRNEARKVIYVGKAVVLRQRVRSYFQASANHTPRIEQMVDEVADITWWVTRTELEALILENDLIKRYKPRYNVMLKDDKSYPYIKINWQDDFPKVEKVRQMVKDGARYFGPFTSGRAVGQTLDALRRVFPYLDCDRRIDGQDERPCLYYHLKLCGGPCIGAQSRAEYRQTIGQMIDFLEGDAEETLANMEAQMLAAAEAFQFELAAVYRDRIKAARRIVEHQQVVGVTQDDEDVIAISQDAQTGDTVVQTLFVRKGRLMGKENFALEGAEVLGAGTENLRDLLATFIQQFYDNVAQIPPRILIQYMPTNAEVLTAWLREHRGQSVELRMPQRGKKMKLMDLARRNAEESLRVQQAEWAADTNRHTAGLAELQAALNLSEPPNRIECYDISTLQGTNTTGSMVLFVQGAPQSSGYRRFKIRGKGSQGEPDDFASMEEMLRRRFQRATQEPSPPVPGSRNAKANEQWRILPDLIIVDGGKGQLGVAVALLKEFDLFGRVPVVGLAKREEEVFVPGQSEPIWLKRGSQALYLVQRVRDEAHRYAVTYHRTLRSKAQIRSRLDEVPGIGPARKKALLLYFGGDIEKIRAATLEDLQAVPGMNRKAAEAVKNHL
jgi:excinuclease ABC subunit C